MHWAQHFISPHFISLQSTSLASQSLLLNYAPQIAPNTTEHEVGLQKNQHTHTQTHWQTAKRKKTNKQPAGIWAPPSFAAWYLVEQSLACQNAEASPLSAAALSLTLTRQRPSTRCFCCTTRNRAWMLIKLSWVELGWHGSKVRLTNGSSNNKKQKCEVSVCLCFGCCCTRIGVGAALGTLPADTGSLALLPLLLLQRPLLLLPLLSPSLPLECLRFSKNVFSALLAAQRGGWIFYVHLCAHTNILTVVHIYVLRIAGYLRCCCKIRKQQKTKIKWNKVMWREVKI